MSLLSDIAASPRGTGTGAIDVARARCATELRGLGFEVAEQPFTYSGFPGRYATPLFGAAGAMLVGVAGDLSVGAAARFAPVAVLLAGAIALWAATRWLMRRGVLDAPVLRARGVNLVATRGGRAPRVWLAAHIDSKSQPVPTLVRSTGLVLEGVGYVLALLFACAAAAALAVPTMLWLFAGVVTLVGSLPVMLSIVTNRSHGALDNASGVATVTEAVRLLGDATVGVLITDAEELGLAGARAWSRSAVAGTTVLNCDGVDDVGGNAVLYSGTAPRALLDVVHAAARREGIGCETTRILPGVLTDSVAFADAGAASVTFSRGSLRSLTRVHTRRDDLAHLRGTGIAQTARLMAETARALGVD